MSQKVPKGPKRPHAFLISCAVREFFFPQNSTQKYAKVSNPGPLTRSKLGNAQAFAFLRFRSQWSFHGVPLTSRDEESEAAGSERVIVAGQHESEFDE